MKVCLQPSKLQRMFTFVTKRVIIVQIKPRNDKFILLAPHVRDKDCSNYQLCSEYLILECCKKHSKVGTFEGLFESSTFVYALVHISSK